MRFEENRGRTAKGLFFITCAFLLLAFNLTFAQTPDTAWTRTYGYINSGENAKEVQQTFDGGYIFVGRTSVSGDNEEIYLVKTDSTGDTLWTKTFGGPNPYEVDRGYSVKQTADSGYIITGYSDAFGYKYNIFLLKTDVNGDSVWFRGYEGFEGYSVQQTFDGGYVVAGNIYPDSYPSQFRIIKTDSLGDTLWTKMYGDEGSDDAYSIQQTSDSGYIVVGAKITNQFSGIWLVKTDSKGDILWSRIYKWGLDPYWGSSVKEVSDGYIIAGSRIYANHDIILLKTNAIGDTMWMKIFGAINGDDLGWCVSPTSDGGYLITGQTTSYSFGPDDVFIVKADSAGNRVWFSVIGGASWDYGYSGHQTSDGGYIIAGATEDPITKDWDAYLIKLEPEIGVEEEHNDKLSDLIIPGLVHGNLLKLRGINKHTEVKIFDIIGREVLSQTVAANKSYIHLNNLTPGIYFLSIKEDKPRLSKFVLIK